MKSRHWQVQGVDEALRQLVELGCCAWVGRTACGALVVPNEVVIGGTELGFRSYRCAWLDQLTSVAVYCERHHPKHGMTWADMPAGLFSAQERERKKYKAVVQP